MAMQEPGRASALRSFRLQEEIGSGSTGTVHRGVLLEDRWGRRAGTEIAVKFLHQRLTSDPRARERFLHEARAGRVVHHEHLVEILAVSEEVLLGQEVLFLVMEYVPGPTLRTWLAEPGYGNEPLVRTIGAQLARALHALHDAGVVHLDVKPENVILSRGDRAVLMDLGFARTFGGQRLAPTGHDGVTGDESFAGSVVYAAPERVRGSFPTPACDLYSLGVLLFETLTGEIPFPSPQPDDVLRAKLDGKHRRVEDVLDDVSPFLSEVLARLMSEEPAQRFRDAHELAEILTHGERSTFWTQRSKNARAPRERRLQKFPFTGRERERDLLLRAYDRTHTQGSGIVLVRGAQGMGTQRLLREFEHALSRRADAPQILEGRCPLRGPTVPFGGLLSALRRFLGLAPEDPVEPLLVNRLAEYVDPDSAHTLLGLLCGSDPEDSITFPRAFARFVQGIARRGPLVFVLEYIENAAPSTLRTLELVLERAPDTHPVLLIGTARPAPLEQNVDLVAALERLERLGLLQTIDLEPLLADQVRDLIRALMPTSFDSEPFASALHAETGGAPGFIIAVLKDLIAGGQLAWEGDRLTPRLDIAEIPIPKSVAESVLRRRKELPEDLRLELDRAVCAGQRVSANLLARAFGGSVLQHERDLGRLVLGHDVLQPDGSNYRFTSPAAAELLYDALDAHFRRRAHGALAAAWQALAEDEDPGIETSLQIAYHASQAEDHELALRHLVPLTRRLLRSGSARRAHELATRALEHLDQLESTAEHQTLRLDLLLLHADAAGRAGFREDERGSAERASRIARERNDLTAQLRALIALAYHAHRTSQNYVALAYLERAREFPTEARLPELDARIELIAGIAEGYVGRARQAARRFDLAAKKLGGRPHPVAGDILVARGRGALDTDYLELARERLTQAAHDPNLDPVPRLRASFHLARTTSVMGLYDEALHNLDECLERERGFGDLRTQAAARSLYGEVLLKIGRFEEARDHLVEAVELAERIQDRYTLVYTWTHRAFVRMRLDDVPGGLRAADRAVAIADDLDHARLRAGARAMRALLLLKLGRAHAAIASAERALHLHRPRKRELRHRAALHYTLFKTLHEAGGDPDQALRHLHWAWRIVHARSIRIADPELRTVFLGREWLHRKVVRALESCHSEKGAGRYHGPLPPSGILT